MSCMTKLATGLALALAFTLPAQAQEDKFVGLGIVIQSEAKSFQIVDIYENSPAEKEGLVIGEWIDAVDGKETKGKSLKDVSKMLKGEVDTKVMLTLASEDRETTRDVELTRALIVVKCFMLGSISLSYNGNSSGYGTLSGYVAGEYVNWYVSGNYISAPFKDEYLPLRFEENNFGDIMVSGWVNGAYIYWRGSNYNIYAFQNCIR